MRLSGDYPGVDSFCANNSDFVNETLLNTTYQPILSNMGPNATRHVWCRRDYLIIPDKQAVNWQFAMLGPVSPDYEP